MGTDPKRFFEDAFESLTGRAPYPWQTKLFLEIVSGKWPGVVPLPTGSGKTAVLHIWLFALVWSIRTGEGGVPRRLAWVVNRRVVVDQVTKEAEDLLGKGLDRWPEVQGMALSTLRGQRADNGEWSRDPSRPAIMIGTVDMIGSRLLFRGYGSGPYHRPIHAGLLGVDTLIVNDEAHLSPAFARLLKEIHCLEPASQIPGKNFRVLLLSATPDESRLDVFEHSPMEDAAESDTFRRVFEAPKRLVMHQAESKSVESTVWHLATENPGPRTVVFIEKPEGAAAFADRLEKEGRSVALMTGTMRGFERDSLAENDVFKKFLEKEPPANPVWLVATSAAEVGVNLTCERLITGLVPADQLLQRFGRLNRFGVGEGEAHVVYAVPKQERLLRTLDYLRVLGGDISCRNVWGHRCPDEAKSEPPRFARFQRRLIDIWAQTTYKDKHVPVIAPWLHGKEDEEAPEAELVWRADVEILAGWHSGSEEIERLLEYYPIRAHERLREPASRILNKLNTLSERLGEDAATTKVIRINSDGTAEIKRLTDFKENEDIAYRTLILPDALGSLPRGMFKPERASESRSPDVADEKQYARDEKYGRRRYYIEDGTWTPLPRSEREASFKRAHDRVSLAEFANENRLKAPLVIRDPDDQDGAMLVYFAETVKSYRALREVGLSEHLSAVEKRAGRLAVCAGLDGMAEKFAKAGRLHDGGKKREVWQNAFGGCQEKPIAKSKAPKNLRVLGGYRHELGSLLDAAGEDDELVLHLIASHHAGARPFFSDRQFDRESSMKKSAEAALEAVRRYARLQNKYGPWGLAYLEAIFKSADGLVSAEEGGAVSE